MRNLQIHIKDLAYNLLLNKMSLRFRLEGANNPSSCGRERSGGAERDSNLTSDGEEADDIFGGDHLDQGGLAVGYQVLHGPVV